MEERSLRQHLSGRATDLPGGGFGSDLRMQELRSSMEAVGARQAERDAAARATCRPVALRISGVKDCPGPSGGDFLVVVSALPSPLPTECLVGSTSGSRQQREDQKQLQAYQKHRPSYIAAHLHKGAPASKIRKEKGTRPRVSALSFHFLPPFLFFSFLCFEVFVIRLKTELSFACLWIFYYSRTCCGGIIARGLGESFRQGTRQEGRGR
jgi:hypothetical protein